ncbi:MAG TPA: hypothetical protein IAB54_11220 [Candidatus Scatomonas merdigallinarum]|nr:hypothetical protein [Candidatus Scatomonas merdigallinarum]
MTLSYNTAAHESGGGIVCTDLLLDLPQ